MTTLKKIFRALKAFFLWLLGMQKEKSNEIRNRSIYYWLDRLPEPYRSLALKYEHDQRWGISRVVPWRHVPDKPFSAHEALKFAFNWKGSDEGRLFWSRLHVCLHLGIHVSEWPKPQTPVEPEGYSIFDWLNKLPEPYRSLALKYEHDQRWGTVENANWRKVNREEGYEMRDALMDGFSWSDSDESRSFWYDVYCCHAMNAPLNEWPKPLGTSSNEEPPTGVDQRVPYQSRIAEYIASGKPAKTGMFNWKNQGRAVKKLLIEYGHIDTKRCKEIGLYRVKKAIYDLRRKGYVIKTQIQVIEGKKHYIYKLILNPEEMGG